MENMAHNVVGTFNVSRVTISGGFSYYSLTPKLPTLQNPCSVIPKTLNHELTNQPMSFMLNIPFNIISAKDLSKIPESRIICVCSISFIIVDWPQRP